MTRTSPTIDVQIEVSTAAVGTLEIVAVAISPTQATLQLCGELDFVTVGLVATALEDQLARGHRFVRLDLSRLTMLDRAGLRALVDAHDQFLLACGAVVLTEVGDCVMQLLRLTHLDEALYIADGHAGGATADSRTTPCTTIQAPNTSERSW